MSVNDPALAAEWDKTCRALKEAAKQRTERHEKEEKMKRKEGFRIGMGGNSL